MPRRKERGRGGVVRYRTKKVRGGYFHIAVMRRRGKRGGRTVAGPLHRYKRKR